MMLLFFQSGTLCLRVFSCAVALILLAESAFTQPRHGIAMYGEPALPENFTSLPYSNPNAPKGGRIILDNPGTFTSLNPFIRKGTVPWQLRFLTHDSLMGRNRDEPFALYGLLAESIETPPDRSWVEFTLRPEARFSDGSPVTVEDVIWSFETLGTQGNGRYAGLWSQIETIRQTGPDSLRISFASENRELALLAGLRPVLKKSQWDSIDFANAGLDEVPIGSGPYVVDGYEVGRRVTLKRNPDYWAKDLPIRRGTHNFDEVVIDFYADGTVIFEAFKAGEISAIREFNAERWASQYDFPAIERGDIVKTEIFHQKPSGITGFAINTRRKPLDDWRVRDALIEMFNFEYINDTLNNGRQPRITSFFSGSPLASQAGPASPEIRDLLEPFKADLIPGVIDGYALPQTDARPRNRSTIRKAISAMLELGYDIQDGVMTSPEGRPMVLTLVVNTNNTNDRAIADIYQKSLQRIGVELRIDRVDPAQFTERASTFDFDLISYRRAVTLSPGNEQRAYWGGASADQEGSRNLAGISEPAIDAMIDAMLVATDQEDFVAAVQALDRLLTAGRYVIPFARFDRDRIAHVRQMRMPDHTPLYGDGAYFMPQHWWWEE